MAGAFRAARSTKCDSHARWLTFDVRLRILFILMGCGTAVLGSDWDFIDWILNIRAPPASWKLDSMGSEYIALLG